MRLRNFSLLLALAFCLAALSGCSRESSVKENINLRNNHSVIFAFNKPFENPEAFADSIINLNNPDSVLVFDTLTVTVNDTIYLMGFLRYNADKIYRYVWHFEEADSNVISGNTMVQSWSYKKPGLYTPLFIAVDGNNAKDTAGVGQYIRVIDTPPTLVTPRDTVWTRARHSVTFPILASDSFGTITSIKVDLDAKGKKAKPKKWSYETKDDNDSLYLTIDYDSTRIDSLGNQKIYVIAIDDDDNETIDSVNLHFNQPPTLKLLRPLDNSRFSDKERFAFYYNAEDKDNPASLRYFVRAAKSRDNSGTPPVLTNNDLIAKNIKEKSFEGITADGKNMMKDLSGRLYWDVWVTDGYDTVFSERIKVNKNTTRPWTFFLGDLTKTTGEFYGFVKYDGWSHHENIMILFEDTLSNRYFTKTDSSGYFSYNIQPGKYHIWAYDTTQYRFASDSISTWTTIEIGENIFLDTVVLKDTADPIIQFNPIDDTLTTRKVELNGKQFDYGSQVKSYSATLDGKKVKLSTFTQNSWSVILKDLADGKHKFRLAVTDSAGRTSDTLKVSFFIMATDFQLTVNDQAKKMIDKDSKFTFKATIKDANPAADSIYFITDIAKADTFKVAVKDEVAILELSKSKLPSSIALGKFYSMIAKTPSGLTSDKVLFGYFGDGPIVYFESPKDSLVTSINDSIDFKVYALANNTDTENPNYKLTWHCKDATQCIDENTESGKFAWAKAGTKTLVVTIENMDHKTFTDSVRIIVVADPPTLRVTMDGDTTKQKINSHTELFVTASDKFGTVNKISWGCSNGSLLNLDNEETLTPKKSITNYPLTIILPGTPSSNYKCVIQVVDNDNETAEDTIKFNVVLDPPYISINEKKKTLSIKDVTPLNFIAKDTLGSIEKYEIHCDSVKSNLHSEWTNFSPSANITMPQAPCKWYCAVRVTDDDGNTAIDTATYTVLQDPPTVKVLGDYTVTIKDTLGLDAIADDVYGKIVKYEWGCGAATTTNIGFTYSSTKSPSFNAIMPSTPQDSYQCIIRVTDDDGNTAKDTTKINVILAPPSVTIENKSTTVREGYNIILNASAYDYPDYPGYIVKQEWSCNEPSSIAKSWKTVSSFDTVWKAPSPVAKFYCIARVTDNDGNVAMDTMNVNFSTDLPVISVKEKEYYVVPGGDFSMDATVNKVWQGISWFTWECIDAETKKSYEKKVTKYSYYDNNNSFYDYRDSSMTSRAKDLLCIVTAEEKSTKATFSDTMKVKILRNPPVGKISAADTVFLWSGDESVKGFGLYFYTEEWGGMKSELGTIGNKKKQDFWWKFSTVDDNFYQGNSDGTLDTSTYEFNSAFIRSTSEGKMTICLDYRDSISENSDYAFKLRHYADETCRKVYFSKAWKNQATSDTVLSTTQMTTPPVLAIIKDKPAIAYLTAKNKVETKYMSGNSWKTLDASAITVNDSITQLRIASSENDLYLAILTSQKELKVYKSSQGTSSWASYANSINNVKFVSLTIHSTDDVPVIAYATNDGKAYVANKENGNWNSREAKYFTNTREVAAAYTSGGTLTFIGINNEYRAYYTLYDKSFSAKAIHKDLRKNVNGVSLTSNGSDLYMGFLNRDSVGYGPYVYKASVGSSDISWTKSGIYGKSLKEGTIAYHISVATYDGNVYAIFDDMGKPSLAQSHVYSISQNSSGSSWQLLGENELPYFKANFYEKNKYYLRGSNPNIAVTSGGKIYISLLAWENAGGSGKNYGPIVMKYVADTWTVHE